MKKKDKLPTDGAAQLSHNPFAALAQKRDELPPGAAQPAARDEPPAPAPPKGPARAVVRYERKGRGGKEVTLIEQLGLPQKQLEAWLKELKGALGCGGLVEDDALVLQGDQRKRAPGLLEKRGVRKVSIS